MKNKQVIKAITIGISASMLLNPVVALAEGLEEDSSEAEEKVTGDSKEGDILAGAEGSSEAAAATYEGVEKELGDTATELTTASGYVGEAGKVEGTDYSKSQEALEGAIDNTRKAEEDVRNAEKALDDEKKDAGDVEKYADLAQEKVADASTAISDAQKAAADAQSKDASVDASKSSETEASKAVQDIQNDVDEVEKKLEQARENLSDAQTDLKDANNTYNDLLADKNASEKALSDAKQKVTESETALSEAEKEVEANEKIAKDLEEVAGKLEVYNQISELQKEIEDMDPDDKEYPAKEQELSELIFKYYLIEKIDEGTEITFGEDTEKYVIGYKEDEEGNLAPEYKEISYRTVTYTVDGVTTTKKFDCDRGEDGAITINEKDISAEKSEITILPKVELTDADGNTYVATDTSHVISKSEDPDDGFFAIDTEVSTPLSQEGEEELLPKDGSQVVGRDENGNVFVMTYENISEAEGAQESVSYELDKSGRIVEVTSREFDVEYELSTEYVEEVSGFNSWSEASAAALAREEELMRLYPDSYDSYSPNCELRWNKEKGSYILIYNLIEKKTGKQSLAVAKTTYDTKEFIDRAPATYKDEDGNAFVENEDTVIVYLDSKDKKQGFYAADKNTDWVGDEASEPENYSIYERDEYGRAKRTTIDHVEKYGVNQEYSEETYSLITETVEKVTERKLEAGEDLYTVLNELQKARNATVQLKGIGDDPVTFAVDFKNPRWYEAAEEDYKDLIEETGGCELVISEWIPVTEEVTGIVERETEKYSVLTGVYVIDSQSGACEDEDDAWDALWELEQAAKNMGYPCRIIVSEVNATPNEDGEYEYHLEYELTLSFETVTKDIVRKSTVYRDTKYTNADAQVKDIYTVAENDKALMSTDDAAYSKAISEKKEAYKEAKEAKEKIDKAEENYKDALEAVTSAREALEALEKEGAPEKLLAEAKAKYETAQSNLSKALDEKTKAEVALANAKTALTNATEKLNKIKGASSSGGSGGTSSVIPGNVADAGSTSSSTVEAPAAAAAPAANATTSTVQATASQPEGEVLGAIRYGKAKVGKKASADEKADTGSEEVKQDKESSTSTGVTKDSGNSSTSDNSKPNDNKNEEEKPQGTTIEEPETPLINTPVSEKRPMAAIILTLVSLAAAGIIGLINYFSKKGIR